MKERSLKLDYFRAFLSILVITPHIQPLFEENSLSGWLISNGIARIAVPCFFLISGYFIHFRLDNKEELKKYLLHLLIVYITWSIIYLPIYYSTIEPRSLITFAFMGYYHLWFLPALILGIIVLAILRRLIKSDTILLISGISLFLLGYLMENNDFHYRSFCNGLFFGYPFVLLGYLIQKNNLEIKFKNTILIPLLLISLTTLLLESYLGYKENFYHNIFLSLYVLSPLLFISILKGAKRKKSNSYIGKLGAGIYYIHVLVLTLIIPLSESYNIYKYPTIAIISILLSIFIIFLNKRIKIFL